MIRILLLSDLHAFSAPRPDGTPSYIDARKVNATAGDDALEGLRQLIDRDSIKADLLVCAGDIGDRADSGGIGHAWRAMQEIAKRLTGRAAVAVCGNHDLDSRFLSNSLDPDPKGVLQELTPIFPVEDEFLCDRFWSRGYVTMPGPTSDSRLLLINTSAYHGGRQDEINHGRITHRTVRRIRETLIKEGHRAINILVCHHHPFPHSKLDATPDYESITNGQALLDLLDDPSFGPWLILHGHRHHPRIAFAPGAVSPPIVIGAASFSAKIVEASNQVHLIDVSSSMSANMSLCGTVTSWTYAFGIGFSLESNSTNALPGRCGFGFRGQTDAVAKAVDSYVRASSTAYVEWSDVSAAVEGVRFLNPDQFLHCIRAIKRLGIQVLFDEQGIPTQALVRS